MFELFSLVLCLALVLPGLIASAVVLYRSYKVTQKEKCLRAQEEVKNA